MKSLKEQVEELLAANQLGAALVLVAKTIDTITAPAAQAEPQ